VGGLSKKFKKCYKNTLEQAVDGAITINSNPPNIVGIPNISMYYFKANNDSLHDITSETDLSFKNIVFQDSNHDATNGWCENHYKIPYQGIYQFTFSCFMEVGEGLEDLSFSIVQKDSDSTKSQTQVGSKGYNSENLTTILDCSKNDLISVKTMGSQASLSSITFEGHLINSTINAITQKNNRGFKSYLEGNTSSDDFSFNKLDWVIDSGTYQDGKYTANLEGYYMIGYNLYLENQVIRYLDVIIKKMIR